MEWKFYSQPQQDFIKEKTNWLDIYKKKVQKINFQKILDVEGFFSHSAGRKRLTFFGDDVS